MTLRKGKVLYETELKKIFLTNEPDQCIIHFMDKITTVKTTGFVNGAHANAVATALLRYLESYQIPTYFIEQLKPNEMIVSLVELIPVNVHVWNMASGELAKCLGLKKGELLKCPVMEFHLIDGKGKESLVNCDHICALEIATLSELQFIDRMVRKINTVIKSYFERRELFPLDFTLQFGRADGDPILCDSVTLENCQLMEIADLNGEKPVFKPVSEGLDLDGYEALSNRICQ